MNNTTSTDPAISYGSAQGPPSSSWDVVTQFLRRTAGRGAYSVMTVHILTDDSGRPIVWASPKINRLEPRTRGQQLADFLETFSK
jgi:hypothetical protein